MWMCNKEKEHRIYYIGQLAKRNLWHIFSRLSQPLLWTTLPTFMTKTSKAYSFSTKKAKKNQTTQTPFSVQVRVLQREIDGKKTTLQNEFMNQIIINKSTKHHFIHFLWLQGLGDFSPTNQGGDLPVGSTCIACGSHHSCRRAGPSFQATWHLTEKRNDGNGWWFE